MKGRDGSNPRLSARQSAIAALSAENPKIGRMFAHFLLAEGTGEAQIRPSAANLWSILPVENRAGAPRAIVCQNKRSPGHRPFSKLCQFNGAAPLFVGDGTNSS
jgi:hypothetical protein